jgi:hypothetical protein
VISAELATRVAEAYDAQLTEFADTFEYLSGVMRQRILAVAEAVVSAERAKHKADLQAIAACVEDAIGELE